MPRPLLNHALFASINVVLDTRGYDATILVFIRRGVVIIGVIVVDLWATSPRQRVEIVIYIRLVTKD